MSAGNGSLSTDPEYAAYQRWLARDRDTVLDALLYARLMVNIELPNGWIMELFNPDPGEFLAAATSAYMGTVVAEANGSDPGEAIWNLTARDDDDAPYTGDVAAMAKRVEQFGERLPEVSAGAVCPTDVMQPGEMRKVSAWLDDKGNLYSPAVPPVKFVSYVSDGYIAGL